MKKFFKILNKGNSSSGFTLIELLIAALITTIVVSVAGSGLVAISANNNKAKAENNRRVELNRALDFMADEVRQAKAIATDADANLSTVASDFNSSSKTPVLTLQIPDVPQRVIYYLASPSPNWLGPKVIYRWGPSFNGNGTYSNAGTPATWGYEPLVDRIEDSTPSQNPICETGSFANPDVASRQGFYACVNSNSKFAEIYLRGRLTDAYNNTIDPLKVSTKVFVRPADPPAALLTPPTTPTFTTSGGTVNITQPSDVAFQVIGGSMNCPGVGEIPTTTTINVTNGATTTRTTVPSSSRALNFPSVSPGTRITVTGFADNSVCYGTPDHTFHSDTNAGRQVLSLRNGDRPPLFTAYGSQPNINTIVGPYLNADGTVKLAENQVIYLYELFTTNRNDPNGTYDMQDLIVLATITPS